MKIFFFILMTFFIQNESFAGKVPIHIENRYYDEPTLLLIKVRYREEKKENFEVEIPARTEEKIELQKDIPVEKNFKSFSFQLLTLPDNDLNGNKADAHSNDRRRTLKRQQTMLASCTFKPCISPLNSLALIFSLREIKVSATYDLPPKFSSESPQKRLRENLSTAPSDSGSPPKKKWKGSPSCALQDGGNVSHKQGKKFNDKGVKPPCSNLPQGNEPSDVP
jgi:hypothetical protein